jgi:1,2-dihydroxy-3-keto-5-methylthiopentene dioxygenase
MSVLLVYSDADPERLLSSTKEPRAIAAQLARHAIRFEQWSCAAALPDVAGQDEILNSFAAELDRLKRQGGYQSADVVRLKRDPGDPDWPNKARTARAKFLEEHRHAEDEVRFFVEGSGLFALRLDAALHLVLCERGDLLSVPAGTRHWFDMGSEPYFCAIRVFGSSDGWLATFTGDPIAQRFPSYDRVAAEWR